MAWEPQPGAQSSAILADWCEELFYGGERGGGKSDYQLGYQEEGALTFGSSHRGIMFRKTYPELEELQSRAIEIFTASGAKYKTQPSADYPFTNCWYWPNGASVKMRYIEHERDYSRYHGHQYTRISFDEVTEYATPAGILKMISTLRSAHGVPCSMRCTGNPGGIGHAWVKSRYIDVSPPYVPFVDPDTGFTRMFIPSKLADNKILSDKDPGYRNRIYAATEGNEALRQAWLEGNWDIVAGQAFEKLRRYTHGIRPIALPDHIVKFRSLDWGSSKPFSVGWWAVSDGQLEAERLDGKRITIQRGALIRYREWYGWDGHPDVGKRLETAEVALGIIERSKSENYAYTVADPAMWKVDGGPSHAETFAKNGVLMRQADNKRHAGYLQVRDRIAGDENGPMLYVFDNCLEGFWRTMPYLVMDQDDLEDVDTDLEDHAYDEVRYACMSRPYMRLAPKQPEDVRGALTFNEILKQNKQRQQPRKRI